MVDRVGQQLGNYRVTRLLGRGGFADVYLGEHIYLKTPVAIKVLQARLTYEEDLNGFLKEAQTVARLMHPNIVRVTDFGIADETPYLVMDYAAGGTLRQRHTTGSHLPLTTIVPYIVQLADALQYAHNEKLIHRDIKPENMLIGARGDILLSDFGIALVSQSSRYQGTQQDITGTAAYMAPEQLQGKPSRASDQYALGITAYEWLCGERPFHGSFIELYAQHVNVPPPSLRAKVPSLPPDVEHVIMTALAKDAKQRFGNISAFANALAQASGQAHLVKSRPITLSTPADANPQPPVAPLSPPVELASSPATPPPTSAEHIFSGAFRDINTGNSQVQTPAVLPQGSDLSMDLIAAIQAQLEGQDKVKGSDAQPTPAQKTPQAQADILADIDARLAAEERARQAQAAKQAPPPQPTPRSSNAQADVLADIQAQISVQRQAKQVPPPPPPANQQTPIAARPAPQVQPIRPQGQPQAPIAQPAPVRQPAPVAQPIPPPSPIHRDPYGSRPSASATAAKPAANTNMWRFGGTQIVAIIIGTILYTVSYNFSIPVNSSTLAPGYLVSLFFGAIFGPWVGLAIGAIGSILGSKIFFQNFPTWPEFLSESVIGLIAGLASLSTKGRYASFGAAFRASIISTIGLAVGIVIASIPFLNLAGNVSYMGNFIMVNGIMSIIVLPIVLLIYSKIVHRAKA